ncbi:MAG: LiaI-LiaF-like domain-containing protein [Candidatus Dormibacteraceae bacterium]
MRPGRLFWPLVLVAIGVVALLANYGALQPGSLWRLAALWPLLLILIGVEVVVARTAPPPAAAAIIVALFVLVLAAAIAYVAVAPATGTAGTLASTGYRGSLAAARLELDTAAVRLEVRTASIGDQLYRAEVRYRGGADRPVVSFDPSRGLVRIAGSNSDRGFLHFGPASETVTLVLSDRLPWAVAVNGAAVDGTADLSSGSLSRLEVNGVGGRLDLRLPKPSGTVPVDITGAALRADLHFPPGVEEHVHTSGTASSVDVFGDRFNGFGSRDWSSAGYASATDRYQVNVSGAATSISLDHS